VLAHLPPIPGMCLRGPAGAAHFRGSHSVMHGLRLATAIALLQSVWCFPVHGTREDDWPGSSSSASRAFILVPLHTCFIL